jgi:leader peptidase (prepilin peptidase)/N-methyltransferase
VELVTAGVFTLVFAAYMVVGLRQDMPIITAGPAVSDWITLGMHLWLVAALLAASAVDLRLSIIPLSITSLTGVVAVVLHGFFPGPMLATITSPTAGLAVGACLGLIVSVVLLSLGIFRPTFRPMAEDGFVRGPRRKRSRQSRRPLTASGPARSTQSSADIRPRLEILHEMLYLTPPVVLGLVGWLVASADTPLALRWQTFVGNSHVNALTASLFGLLVGGGLVWLTRILGTLAFGREAMGLGDVHLMAAAGAVLGCLAPILAFFIAPFYGLLAALLTAVRHRQGELPYGPWLSLGLLTIMLFQDKIWAYLSPGLEVAWQLLTGG